LFSIITNKFFRRNDSSSTTTTRIPVLWLWRWNNLLLITITVNPAFWLCRGNNLLSIRSTMIPLLWLWKCCRDWYVKNSLEYTIYTFKWDSCRYFFITMLKLNTTRKYAFAILVSYLWLSQLRYTHPRLRYAWSLPSTCQNLHASRGPPRGKSTTKMIFFKIPLKADKLIVLQQMKQKDWFFKRLTNHWPIHTYSKNTWLHSSDIS
jgi:hypothetical protein